jgi:(2Fe-2S) ferredoxin/precorrin-6B methylase 2
MTGVFRRHVLVCTQEKPDGIPCCAGSGGRAILEAFKVEVEQRGLLGEVLVTATGCTGLCERGPTVVVYPEGHWYTAVQPTEVGTIVARHVVDGVPLTDRADPPAEAIRGEIAAHRAKVRAVAAARAQAGVLPDETQVLTRAFQASRAFLSAVELDLFTAVGEGGSASEIAARAGADARGTEALLNVLAALGLLVKEKGRYRGAEVARTFLVAGGKHDSRAAIQHSVNLWTRWSTLTEAVRRGGPVAYSEMVERGSPWTEAFIAAMHRNAALRAPQVAAALDLSHVRRMLDLGGGSGAYSIALARAKPDLEAVIFDLPTVTPLTRRYIEESGLTERVRTVEGDLRRDPYGSGFDLILISAICHMNGPEENVAMLRRAALALAPGGQVVVQDFILNDEKTAPLSGVLFALNMLVGTRQGSSYSEREYREWMATAGLTETRHVSLPGPSGLMIGMRGR